MPGSSAAICAAPICHRLARHAHGRQPPVGRPPPRPTPRSRARRRPCAGRRPAASVCPPALPAGVGAGRARSPSRRAAAAAPPTAARRRSRITPSRARNSAVGSWLAEDHAEPACVEGPGPSMPTGMSRQDDPSIAEPLVGSSRSGARAATLRKPPTMRSHVSPEVEDHRPRAVAIVAARSMNRQVALRDSGLVNAKVLRPRAADQGRDEDVMSEAGDGEQLGHALDQADRL